MAEDFSQTVCVNLDALDSHERHAARLQSRTYCRYGHADILCSLAFAFSKVTGSASDRRARNLHVNTTGFRFALRGTGKDPMTFLTNEQTRMSSSQSWSWRSDPTSGWCISRVVRWTLVFVPRLSESQRDLPTRSTSGLEGTFGRKMHACRCLPITPHVVCVHWKRGMQVLFVVVVEKTHPPSCKPYRRY